MRARRIGLGLCASAALHAALAAVALWRVGRSPETAEPPIELVLAEIELIDEAEPPAEPDRDEAEPPIEVEPAVEPAVEATPRQPEPRPPAEPEPRDARTAETRAALDSRTTAPGPVPPEPPAQDARPDEAGVDAPPGAEGPSPASPGIDPRRAAEAIVLDPGPAPAPGPLEGMRRRKPARVRSELRPDGLAGFKTDEGVFVAHTRPDGTVSFKDRPNLRIKLHLPTPARVARGLEAWYDSLAPERRPRWVEGERPRAELDDVSGGVPPLSSGSFDITDGFMRGAGQDPYAARKMEFLDRTRDERNAMATVAKSAHLREALHRTRGDLDRLWRGPGSPAAKRALLFALWDECAERGAAEVVATARAVRGAIVAFVRRNLPAGSRHAFSAEELARHNARRTSTARFDPYADP
jgi:outer membrane biosynthesis protein TonB